MVPRALSAETMAGISACMSEQLHRAPVVCGVCDRFIGALDAINGTKPYRDVPFAEVIGWQPFLKPYADAWARKPNRQPQPQASDRQPLPSGALPDDVISYYEPHKEVCACSAFETLPFQCDRSIARAHLLLCVCVCVFCVCMCAFCVLLFAAERAAAVPSRCCHGSKRRAVRRAGVQVVRHRSVRAAHTEVPIDQARPHSSKRSAERWSVECDCSGRN